MLNQDLIDDVVKGRFVLFIGAGVSKAAKLSAEKDYIKDWADFLKFANSHLQNAKLKKDNK